MASSAVSVQGLVKRYGNGVEALKGVDFQVAPGDFVALLGPNGAGKSTIIGVLCSLVNKTAGSVRIFDVDIDQDFPAAKRLLGVVPQEFNFNQFEKVEHIVINQAGYYGIDYDVAKARTERYLKKLGLWDKRSVMSRTLSGGMKRRLMIARALVHQPKLLILDEPTAGVDIELRRSMWEFLREENAQGTTIILTTHYLEEAEQLCRTVGIIDQGQIVQYCPMKELLAQLNVETFVFDIAGAMPNQLSLEGFTVRVVDECSFEVDVCQGQTINDIFAQLSERGVEIRSMRNKANRLEELFVRLVESQNGEGATHA